MKKRVRLLSVSDGAARRPYQSMSIALNLEDIVRTHSLRDQARNPMSVQPVGLDPCHARWFAFFPRKFESLSLSKPKRAVLSPYLRGDEAEEKAARRGCWMKRYDVPATPCDRSLTCATLDAQTNERLRTERARFNPFALSEKVENATRIRARSALWWANRRAGRKASGSVSRCPHSLRRSGQPPLDGVWPAAWPRVDGHVE